MKPEKRLEIDPGRTSSKIESFIRKKVGDFNRNGVIFGLSGGIDSAVLASLCVRAVGRKNVVALVMPEKESSRDTVDDAMLVAKDLEIKAYVVDLSNILQIIGSYNLPTRFMVSRKLKEKAVKGAFEYYKEKTGEDVFSANLLGTKGKIYPKLFSNGIARYRIRHRLRMIMLYYYAELKNLLVVGAANRTEAMTGFFVKYGIDCSTDIMPLIGLYKTHVKQLAEYLKVPEKIIKKTPSPDIMPGIVDEYALGMSYDKLDLVLCGLEKNMALKQIAKQADVSEKEVKRILKTKEDSTHMRELPYSPEL